ncbi:MAG: hypothetical protein ACTHU0_25480 [Kofleriaceae bacterium]
MHRRLWIGGVLAGIAAAPPWAAAGPDVVPQRAIVVGRVGEGAWTDAPTEARLDQKAELAAVVIGQRGRTRVVLAPPGIDRVTLDGRSVATEPLDARVQWSTVEPHGFRTTRPATNGATSDYYTNVSVEPASFGRWLGHDHIDYFERVVAPWGAAARIPAAVTSGEPGAQQLPGLGTIRYKVEIELAGATLASPGAASVDALGVRPDVHRVSIRRGDDFLGRLSSYLLVPEVFGSAGSGRNHQTERFTGADCADVLVGAMRRTGRTLAYTNVAGLPAYARPITKAIELDDHGTPATPITGVREGDLIRIDYGGALRGHTPRAFDHVAALWEDRSDPEGPYQGGPDGQLDGFDLVIHMGHPRLVIEPLSEQSPATIDVLRWRDQK